MFLMDWKKNIFLIFFCSKFWSERTFTGHLCSLELWLGVFAVFAASSCHVWVMWYWSTFVWLVWIWSVGVVNSGPVEGSILTPKFTFSLHFPILSSTPVERNDSLSVEHDNTMQVPPGVPQHWASLPADVNPLAWSAQCQTCRAERSGPDEWSQVNTRELRLHRDAAAALNHMGNRLGCWCHRDKGSLMDLRLM